MTRVRFTAALVALAFALSACGGSEEPPAETATPEQTSAPVADLTPLLVANDVLPGFQGSGSEPVQLQDAEEWAATNQEPDPAELQSLGFVAGARKDLVGPPGTYGLNIVERFESAAAAAERAASTVRSLAGKKGRFVVSGVPGAVGFESGNGSQVGRSVIFTQGDTVFLLSHQVTKRSPSVAEFKQAAREWYAAVTD